MIFQLRFSIVAGVVLLWSLVGFPFVASAVNAVGLPSTGIVIAVRGVVAAICLALIVVGLVLRRSPASLTYALLLAFFAAYAARIGYDTAFSPQLLSRPAYMYWAFAIGVCLVPALALSLFAPYLDVARLARPLLILSGFVLLLALVAGDTMLEGSAGGSFDTGRLGLTSLNPISLGHVATTVIIIVYWRIRMLRVVGSSLLASLTLGVLGVYVLLATGSRGPLVALIIAILFFEAVKGGRTVVFLSLAAAPFIAALSFDLTQIEDRLGTQLLSRFESGLLTVDASSRGRLEQLASAWDLFLDSPLWGATLEDPAFGIYPHNLIVEAFMAMGVFGGTLLIVLTGLGTIQAFRIAQRSPTLSIYGALFAQYLIGAQFSGSLYTSSTLWALLACIAGLTIKRPASEPIARESPMDPRATFRRSFELTDGQGAAS